MNRKILVSVLLILLSTALVLGQRNQSFKYTPTERAQKNTAWMKAELQLSDDQERLAHEVNIKYAKLNQALADEPGARLVKQRQLKANMDAKDAEMKQILSPQQYKRYLTLKADKQKKYYRQ